ncbi:MAG: AAA family ATPase [Candidatus Hodarchaeales archaeon]
MGIVGARQVGKTTLARSLVKGIKGPPSYFDLENPAPSVTKTFDNFPPSISYRFF